MSARAHSSVPEAGRGAYPDGGGRPWLAALYRLPPAAFSPDWRAVLGAFGAREGAALAAGVYAFDSGRSGLRFALERLAEAAPLRRRVVVPAYTCYSVAAAVEHAGLELVVCDIDPRTLDFAPRELEQVVGQDTLCIVAAQLFGCGVDLDHAAEVARRAGCHVIEDAAQASDPANDVHARAKVTLRLISTGRGKPLSTAGGGFVALYEPALRGRFDEIYGRLPHRRGPVADARQAARLALMKMLVHPRLFWAPASIPALHIGETIYPERIAPERPEALRLRLYPRLRTRFEQERRQRRGHAQVYGAALGAGADEIRPRAVSGADYAPHRFPVYLGHDRDVVGASLRRAGRYGVASVYPAPLTHLPRVRRFCVNVDAPIPGAEWTARHLITLPTHAHVDARSRQRVLNALEELGV
ncbi:MAG: DegT/DnrJ/EryC1/StrS family aminotransferase [Halofilum sp. (in: g-proteobacteria)]